MTRDERWMYEEPSQPEPPSDGETISVLCDALRELLNALPGMLNDHVDLDRVDEVVEARRLLKEITGD
jgi:hypothetical protein